MQRRSAILLGVLGLLVAFTVATPANASHRDGIRVRTGLAPVAPDGLSAGAITDFVITFRDLDPSVPGIGLHSGGTIRVTLPDEFVNAGALPVTGTGSIPGCAPPLVTTCSTAVVLQGWPQSPQLPFPDVKWEEATNTIVVTANADWLPAGVAAPGPKQVHLMLFGFTNPDRPGSYKVELEIQPDPTSDEVLTDTGRARVSNRVRPAVSSISLANGAPPPPFPNTLYQTVEAGDPSLTLLLYLWGKDAEPLVGADFNAGSDRFRPLRDVDGKRIGWVLVRPPQGARNWSLSSGGPATPAAAFITGIDTAALTAVLETDPGVEGDYKVRFWLQGGNTVVHTITAD